MNMEDEFLNLGLDIIGLGVFNFDFSSLTKESPVIKVTQSLALPGASHLQDMRPWMAGSSSADRSGAQTALPMAQCLQQRATHPGTILSVLHFQGQPCAPLKPAGHHARDLFAAFAARARLFALQAVYSVLKEAEHRSTFYIPYWNLPLAMQLVPRQRRFTKNLRVSRSTDCCASCQLP